MHSKHKAEETSKVLNGVVEELDKAKVVYSPILLITASHYSFSLAVMGNMTLTLWPKQKLKLLQMPG